MCFICCYKYVKQKLYKLKNKIMKEKLEELKQMEKMEDLFYELHKNDWFDDESDVISSRGSFNKGFLTAIRLIEEELNKS